MSSSSSSQGMNRIQQELQQLKRSKRVANESFRLKDIKTQLTTPEEATKFLASLRTKEKSSLFIGNPPANLSADATNDWFLQQRQREKDMKAQRKKAEEMLREYRHSMSHRNLSEAEEKKYREFDAHNKHLFQPDASSGSLTDPKDPNLKHHFNPSDRFILPFNSENKIIEEDEKVEEKPPSVATLFKQKLALSPVIGEGSIDPALESEENATTVEIELEEEEKIQWRNFVLPADEDDDVQFPAEKGRYHLFASYACLGSHRALIVRALKGLEDVVDFTILHPIWRGTKEGTEEEQRGWVFGDPEGEPFQNSAGRGGPFSADFEGSKPDPFSSSTSVREIYENAGDETGKFTLPFLWDTKENTIVNNEPSEIAYMFNSSFNEFAENSSFDLYPEEKSQVLSDTIEWLIPMMIRGLYRCGFARTQEVYDKAITELETAFDRAASVLERQRYLTGETLTDADIRLFVGLFRFDEIYHVYFRMNSRMVMLTPALLNFCRDIYQLPGVSETCSMEHCKAHFFCSHAEWNKFSIIPRGIGFVASLEIPHNRCSPTVSEYSDGEDSQQDTNESDNEKNHENKNDEETSESDKDSNKNDQETNENEKD